MDGFVSVTSVLRTAVLENRLVDAWIGSFLWCVAVVRGLLLLTRVFFSSRYTGPALAIVQRTIITCTIVVININSTRYQIFFWEMNGSRPVFFF